MSNPSTPKQIAALRYAIESITKDRRRHYAAGDAAYRQGLRKDVIKDNDITGEVFAFAEEDHKNYVLLTAYINELEDLIDIITDPGVTYHDHTDLPLFKAAK